MRTKDEERRQPADGKSRESDVTPTEMSNEKRGEASQKGGFESKMLRCSSRKMNRRGKQNSKIHQETIDLYEKKDFGGVSLRKG